jgi:hypothetical protein
VAVRPKATKAFSWRPGGRSPTPVRPAHVSGLVRFPRSYIQKPEFLIVQTVSADLSMVVTEERTRHRDPRWRLWELLAALAACPRSRLADGDCIRGFIGDVIPAIGMRAHGPTHLARGRHRGHPLPVMQSASSVLREIRMQPSVHRFGTK